MAKPTYAHFPGRGPAGRTCGDCAHCAGESWSPNGRPHRWCAKALKLAGRDPGDGRAAGPLRHTTPSCRYFEELEHAQ